MENNNNKYPLVELWWIKLYDSIEPNKEKLSQLDKLKKYRQLRAQEPEVKARIKAYMQRPEVKARTEAYMKAYHQKRKNGKQRTSTN